MNHTRANLSQGANITLPKTNPRWSPLPLDNNTNPQTVMLVDSKSLVDTLTHPISRSNRDPSAPVPDIVNLAWNATGVVCGIPGLIGIWG
jgi:hypothetical protein